MEKEYYNFQEFLINVMTDVQDVFDFGGEKHGKYMNFLKIEDFKNYNKEHIYEHLKEYYDEKNILDDETLRNNLTHVICRCIMEMYKDEKEHLGGF